MKKSEMIDKISAILDERKKSNTLTRYQLSWLTRDQLSWFTNKTLEEIKESLEVEDE